LKAEESRRGEALAPSPESTGRGPLVFKMVGTDEHGNRVTAWALLPAASAP
jgi:hypothetical protein